MATELAKAYVQIVPSASGIKGSLTKEMSGAGTAAGKAGGKSIASSIGGGLKTAGKVGAAVMKAAVATTAAVGTAAVVAGKKIIDASGDVAEYGDSIDKMSQKMGLSAEAYQEWDAVMQHSGTSMSAMKSSMKTLANAANSDSGAKAFETLGMSMKDVSKMSQEELFEATISSLQNVSDTTQRTYLAGKLMGRGATELGALLNTSAEDTQAMRDKVHELGGVMSNEAVKASATYQDSLQDMNTAVDGIKRNLLGNLLPGMTQVMDGISDILSGKGSGGLSDGIKSIISNIGDIIPQAIKIIKKVFKAFMDVGKSEMPKLISRLPNFVTGFIDRQAKMYPKLIKLGTDILGKLVTVITKNMPMMMNAWTGAISQIAAAVTNPDAISGIVNAGMQLALSIADGLVGALPDLIAVIPEVVNNLVTVITELIPEQLPLMVESAYDLFMGIAEAVPLLIDTIIPLIPEIVISICNTLITAENISLMLSTAFKLLYQIGYAIGNATPEILKAIGVLIVSMVAAIANAVKSFYEVGYKIGEVVGKAVRNAKKAVKDAAMNLVTGIWEGIQEKLGWLADKVKGVKDTVVGTLKKVFKINSPSGVMRDMIGAYIPEGIAVGITKQAKTVDEALGAMGVKRQGKNGLRFVSNIGGISGNRQTYNFQIPVNIGSGRVDSVVARATSRNAYRFA